MSTISDRSEDVTWRQLQRRLWVASREGRHVGLIEEGRRFTFVEPCGAVHSGYRSLADAQRAVDLPASTLRPERRPLLASAVVVLLLGAIVVAAATLAILAAVGLGLAG